MRSKSREPGRIGRELAAARTKAGLTQDQLAERSGVARATIARLESGLKLATTPLTLSKLSQVLKVEIQPDAKPAGAAAALREYLASDFALQLVPPLTDDEKDRIISTGGTLWIGLEPTPQSLHLFILALRSARKPR